jgi:hypothetical protein
MTPSDDAPKDVWPNDVWPEKRSEPREPAHDPVRLLIDRGGNIDALIVDRSLKGLRLRLPQSPLAALPLTLTALDLNRAVIHQVKMIWKAYPDIGVQVQSSFNVRTGEGREAAAMRRLWLEAASVDALKPVGR